MSRIARLPAKYLIVFFSCLLALCALFLSFQQDPSVAQARDNEQNTARVKITRPLVNGMAVGHPGTKVTITGRGFGSNSNVNLYTTPNNDPGKCNNNNGDPGGNGLTPFTTNPTINAQGDGSFTLDTTWPDTATTQGTPYYICAISRKSQVISINSFTVAQTATITVNQTTANIGDSITVTGSNWLPPQEITVTLVPSNNDTPIATQTVYPGTDGNFSTSLTIPNNTASGTYSIRVSATNEPTLKASKDSALTISNGTPTPTAAPSPTPAATPTTTTGSNTGGSTLNSVTLLIYALGGMGALLIIIGIILFAVYSHA